MWFSNSVFSRSKAREISLPHADALLLTEYTLNGIGPKHNTHINKPRELFGDVVRAAQSYNRTMLLIWDCFFICGLQRFIVSVAWNGRPNAKLIKSVFFSLHRTTHNSMDIIFIICASNSDNRRPCTITKWTPSRPSDCMLSPICIETNRNNNDFEQFKKKEWVYD